MNYFDGKITNKALEEKVIELFGFDNLSKRKTTEEGINLTLYYVKDKRDANKTRHAATWRSDTKTGWIFSEVAHGYKI